MTPSLEIGNGNWAVKSDSLLGYKTIDGKYYPREIGVTRATTATRVNAEGLVELVPYNLFQYSEQLQNAAWVQERATINVNATTAPDGTLTADKVVENTDTNSHRIRQNIASNASVVYTFSGYIKSAGRTKVRVFGGGVNASCDFDLTNGTIIGTPTLCTATITDAGNGWWRCSITYTQNTTSAAQLHLYAPLDAAGNFSYTGDGVSGIYVWGAQLVEGTEPKDYLPTTDRLDIARIDYSTGEAALLVEPQRTNLARWSEQFDNAFWTKQGSTTITANTTIAPNGILTADTLSGADGTGVTGNVLRRNTIDLVDPATWSIWVKSLGATTVSLYMRNGSTGVVTSSTHSIDSNWKRITLTGVIRLGQITIGGTDGDVAIWGAQLEVGSYATSYIPTPGDFDVTRNADVVSMTNASAYIGQTEGTLYAEFELESGSTEFKVISISDGTTNNRVVIAANGQTDLRGFVVYGSTVGTLITSSVLSGFIKIAIAYDASTYTLFINGSQIGTQSRGAFGATLTNFSFDQGNGSNNFYGNVKSAALYKERLSNTELATLTTL